MSLRLTTESEARAGFTASDFVVRYPLVGPLLFMLLWTSITVGFLAWPYWAAPFPDVAAKFTPIFYYIGGVMLLFGLAMYGGVRAARMPSAWLLAANRQQIVVKFRSYFHYRWPREDRVVLVLPKFDVKHFTSFEVTETTGTGKNRRSVFVQKIVLVCHEVIDAEVVRAIEHENRRMVQGLVGRGRASHTPVQVGASGESLIVTLPKLQLAALIAKLQTDYVYKGVAAPEDLRVKLLGAPQLRAEARALIESAIGEGNTIDAIKLLREEMAIGLKEAKDIVERAKTTGRFEA